MEGAVRSGYLAAEGVLEDLGAPRPGALEERLAGVGRVDPARIRMPQLGHFAGHAKGRRDLGRRVRLVR